MDKEQQKKIKYQLCMKKASIVRFCSFLLVSFSCFLPCFSQYHTAMSRSEMGPFVGGMYYIGDLNPFQHFKGIGPHAGFLYRYNIHSRVAFRTNLSYGEVEGNDSWAKDPTFVNRNLHFRSSLFELGVGFEFHYMPFQVGSKRHKGTAYLLAQVAGFYMNPKTRYENDWIYLQPLGTEGQGSSIEGYDNQKRYSLYQIALPVGVGLKLSLGKTVVLGMEYTVRKTFTDYLDDVGSDVYVDHDLLTQANGPLAAKLANRSLNNDRNGKRGTSITKDWYISCLISCTFRLGSPGKCAFMDSSHP